MSVLLGVVAGYWLVGLGRLGWLLRRDYRQHGGSRGELVVAAGLLVVAAWVWPVSLWGDA